MKKCFAIVLVFSIMLHCMILPAMSVEPESDQSVIMGSNTIDSQLPVLGSEQLVINARSVLLYETQTDTLMYAWNADERLPPASLAKILTALIAVEQGDLSAQVTVRQEVLNTVSKNAVKSDILAGEVLTLEDLLHCMMVDSGNDAAAVIADHIAGNQEAFVQQMNEYAHSLGCTNTNFTNAHGIHEENQYSTARDLGRILAAAVQNESFCDIFGAVYYSVPATNLSEDRHLVSENYLINGDIVQIYYDGRVKGSRTGVTEDKNRCIASVAESNGLQVVSIILGSASVYEEGGVKVRSFGGYTETSDLLDLAFDGYQPCQLIYNGQIMKQEIVENGDCYVSLGTAAAAATVLPGGVSVDDLDVQYEHASQPLRAPIKRGDLLSCVKFTYGGKCVAQLDLYAMNSVKSVSNTINTEDNEDTGASGSQIALMILIVILAAIIIVFFAPRIYRLLKSKKKNKQRRRRSR